MIIQIYEVNDSAEARELIKSGVNHIGVLVGKGKYPQELDFQKTNEIFAVVPQEVKKVALTLDWDLKEIIELVEKTHPDILHLGTLPEKLTPEDVKKLKSQFPDLEIMRSIPVIDEKSITIAKKYDGIADYLLLDSYKKENFQIGATGEIHNWDISRKIVAAVKTQVILAGGLGPENVAEAIKKVQPTGVDSKTKTDKAGSQRKDIEKVKEFVRIAKSFE